MFKYYKEINFTKLNRLKDKYFLRLFNTINFINCLAFCIPENDCNEFDKHRFRFNALLNNLKIDSSARSMDCFQSKAYYLLQKVP